MYYVNNVSRWLLYDFDGRYGKPPSVAIGNYHFNPTTHLLLDDDFCTFMQHKQVCSTVGRRTFNRYLRSKNNGIIVCFAAIVLCNSTAQCNS